MKKRLAMFILPFAFLLTGCSALGDVSESLDYVDEAMGYADDVNQFAKELPALAETAIHDLDAQVQLEELLVEMQDTVEQFNVLESPAMLDDIHNQLLEHNEALTNNIDLYLEKIEAGTLTENLLSEIGLMEELSVYDGLMDQLNKLSE